MTPASASHVGRTSRFRSERDRALIADWIVGNAMRGPAPMSSVYVETSFGLTHLLRHASEERDRHVICLHGWGANSGFWTLSGGLSELTQGHHVWVADVPGQPGLSSTAVPGFGRDGYVRWLEDLLDGLGLSTVALVGSSFGALLALQAVAHLPERISTTVLLAPAGVAPVRITLPNAAAAVLHRLSDTAAGAQHFIRTCLIAPKQKVGDDVIARLGQFLRASARGFVNRSAVPPVLPDAALAAVTRPVWLVVGSEDAVFSCERVIRRARAAIPGLAGIRRLEGHGHALELSSDVLEVVRAILTPEGFAS